MFLKMEKLGRGKRPSEDQKQFLVNYLEENIDLAHDRFQTVDGAKHREAEWKKLSELLNAIGGALKDSIKWRKFWTDLRLYTKNNARKTIEGANKSGINGPRVKPLTDLEERMVKLMNYRNIEGDHVTEDLGFETILVEENLSRLIEEEPQSSTCRDEAPPAETPVASNGRASQRNLSQRRIRKRRSDNDANSGDFLKIEEKKIKLREEELKLKKEELEIRKLDLKEKVEIRKTLENIVNCLRNSEN